MATRYTTPISACCIVRRQGPCAASGYCSTIGVLAGAAHRGAPRCSRGVLFRFGPIALLLVLALLVGACSNGKTTGGPADNAGGGRGAPDSDDGSTGAAGDGGDASRDAGDAGDGGDGMAHSTFDGWTDFEPVASDGSHNDTDTGSRIGYISTAGDDATGEYYWWDGSQVVDAQGNSYGNDPFNPAGDIRPFATWAAVGARGGPRYDDERFADWFLFHRGQEHDFDGIGFVGRSAAEHAVLGAYGSLDLERPRLLGGLDWCYCGEPRVVFLAVVSVQLVPESEAVRLVTQSDELVGEHERIRSWLWLEDVLVDDARYGLSIQQSGAIEAGSAEVALYRSIFTEIHDPDAHSQAVFMSGSFSTLRVEESIFYRNGYKSDPGTDENPQRDRFGRNFYLGGGAQMGTTLRNVISADGASGGPEMRYGGTVEESLIIEGYWLTSTDSNGHAPAWLKDEPGQTFSVRNNVQLVFEWPYAGQDAGASSEIAQPGSGFSIQGGSTDGVFEGNIISGALLDELGFVGEYEQRRSDSGLRIVAERYDGDTGASVWPKNSTARDNIFYRVAGLQIAGSNEGWQNAGSTRFENNQWYDRGQADAVSVGAGITDTGGSLEMVNNTFYTDRNDAFAGGNLASVVINADMEGNVISSTASAPWTDPARTLKTYAGSVLGLKVTSEGGLPEFFEHATEMRKGAWDERYTARAVVNYIREGFDLPPL